MLHMKTDRVSTLRKQGLAALLAFSLLTCAGIAGGTASLEEQLIKAAKGEDLEEVKTVLDNGAGVNVKDGNGVTPLMWAARQGRLEIVKILLERGADVNARQPA